MNPLSLLQMKILRPGLILKGVKNGPPNNRLRGRRARPERFPRPEFDQAADELAQLLQANRDQDADRRHANTNGRTRCVDLEVGTTHQPPKS